MARPSRSSPRTPMPTRSSGTSRRVVAVAGAHRPARHLGRESYAAARAHALSHGPARPQHDRAARLPRLDHRRADRRGSVQDRLQAGRSVRRVCAELAHKVNAVIAGNHAVRAYYISEDEFRARGDLLRTLDARPPDCQRPRPRRGDRGIRRAGVRRHPRRHDVGSRTLRDRPDREQGQDQQTTLCPARRPHVASRGR